MRRLWGIMTIALMAVAVSGCGGGSSSDAKGCGTALDSYHAALVASDTDGTGPNLTAAEETSHQSAVVRKCDQATFEALITGPNYDYTAGPDAIAIGETARVYAAFCADATGPNEC